MKGERIKMHKRTRSWDDYNENKRKKIDDITDSLTSLSISEEDSEYNSFAESISDKKMTISKIINSSLTRSEKEDAIQLIQLVEDEQLSPIHAIQLNKALNHFVDGQTPFDNVPVPTLSMILEADLSPYNRILAIQTYQTFYQLSITENLYSQEWYSLRKKLLQLLSVELSVTDVMKNQIARLLTTKENKLKLLQLLTDKDEDKNLRKVKMYLQLPFDKVTTTTVTCKELYEKLNEQIYKMDKIKEKLIITHHHRLTNPTTVSIIALKGVPGSAKTRIVKLLADSLGLPFSKISFGGAHDAKLLTGSEKVWVGSGCSELLNILMKHQCSNGIVLLDEIDKISQNEHGIALQNALLHILDPIQNNHVNDSYLSDITHNLSRVWFIATLNSDDHLDPALKDRLEIVNVPLLSREEMVTIIQNYKLPETNVFYGLEKDDIVIETAACYKLLSNKTGMREVERMIKELVSKLTFGLEQELFNIEKVTLPFTITKKTIDRLLEPQQNQNFMHMYS